MFKRFILVLGLRGLQGKRDAERKLRVFRVWDFLF